MTQARPFLLTSLIFSALTFFAAKPALANSICAPLFSSKETKLYRAEDHVEFNLGTLMGSEPTLGDAAALEKNQTKQNPRWIPGSMYIESRDGTWGATTHVGVMSDIQISDAFVKVTSQAHSHYHDNVTLSGPRNHVLAQVLNLSQNLHRDLTVFMATFPIENVTRELSKAIAVKQELDIQLAKSAGSNTP